MDPVTLHIIFSKAISNKRGAVDIFLHFIYKQEIVFLLDKKKKFILNIIIIFNKHTKIKF